MNSRYLLAALAASIMASSPGWSQGQQAGGFDRAAMQKFRDQHKYTFQLRTMTTMGIMECERSKTTAIKAAQATQILAVLQPLKARTSLSQDQAKAAIKGLQRALDQRQLSAIDKVLLSSQRRMSGGGGGMRPPGAGGQGGPPGGQRPAGTSASRPRWDPAKMKNFNPFNPAKTNPRYKDELDRNNKLFAFLKARAAGKTTTLNLRPAGPPPPPKN